MLTKQKRLKYKFLRLFIETLVAIAAVGYAYFGRGITHPWVMQIGWVKQFPKPDQPWILFSLECASLLTAAGTRIRIHYLTTGIEYIEEEENIQDTDVKVEEQEAHSKSVENWVFRAVATVLPRLRLKSSSTVLEHTPKQEEEKKEKSFVTKPKICIMVLAIVICFWYAHYRILHKDDAYLRYIYAIFCTVLLYLGLSNVYFMLGLSIAPIKDILKRLDIKPDEVFAQSAILTAHVNATIWRASWLLIPLLIWLPTLLSGPSTAKLPSLILGLIFVSITFITPIVTHVHVSNAVNRSLVHLDRDIGSLIMSTTITESRAARIKSLIDLRSTIVAMATLPARSVILTFIQAITTMAALWAAFKPK